MESNDKTFLIKLVYAEDYDEERLDLIVKRFADINKIDNYEYEAKRDESLISGFVIFAGGLRYDYSVKGQLDRISSFIKRNRKIVDEDEIKENDISNFTGQEIKESIEEALSKYDEIPTAALYDKRLWATDKEIEEDDSITLRSVKKSIKAAFSKASTIDEVGTVQSVSDGVAVVDGINKCKSTELIYFSSGATGIAMNLEMNKVGVVLLTNPDTVTEGMICKRTGETVSVPVGQGLLGRVVDPLGNPIDGKGIIRYTDKRPIESPAPSIVDRSPVNQPLQTGITAIDALTPIGRGQRELIIGDRQTGKTAIAIDTIINQKDKNVICVYVAIGQKMSNIVSTVNLLEKHDALSYTVVVAASSSNSASLQYIAPYSGCAIAEEFMYKEKKDVLIVYDDLSKHAQAYRAISLLLRRPPGREAYPGDVFYLHSRLLERSAKLSKELGGASITALPIIETQGGDISAYIPTNVISITDGQIYLEPELFFSGQRPAINVGLSVSRVGGAAQTKAIKKVGGPLRISLAQAREMAAFAQFGSDLDENTQLQLKRGVVLNIVLKQAQYSPLDMEEQVITLFLATTDRLNFLAKEDIQEFVDEFLDYMHVLYSSVLNTIKVSKEFQPEIEERVGEIYDDFKNKFITEHNEYREENG
ncbi:MAG: F0F1 ATP synthase subunit alpha [Clostridiales bacterium]|nr:F0F1 ATP synthase subunit alpha [Clostridiales bacterium]